MKKEFKHHVPIGKSVKPTTFAVGGKVFKMVDFAGVTAHTIKELLKKTDVSISTKMAEHLHKSINGKQKGE